MSTFIVRIQQTSTNNHLGLLQAMKNENFAPITSNENTAEQLFVYYGNMDTPEISDAVTRASIMANAPVYFTVAKDQAAEKQYHDTGFARLK